MAKGPSDIGEENMALKQENMASNQKRIELNQKTVETSQEPLMPNRENRNREAAEMEAARLKEQETEAARLKGQETRRRNYEKRMEKQRLVALAAEEQRLRQRQKDEGFMREALRQAQKAAAIGDVPIGCVIVCGDKIIARGYNRRNADKSVLSHAEIISIKKACKKNRRLAFGGLHHVCNAGAMPHVRRGDCAGAHTPDCSGLHEPQGRLCWVCAGHAPCAGL